MNISNMGIFEIWNSKIYKKYAKAIAFSISQYKKRNRFSRNITYTSQNRSKELSDKSKISRLEIETRWDLFQKS